MIYLLSIFFCIITACSLEGMETTSRDFPIRRSVSDKKEKYPKSKKLRKSRSLLNASKSSSISSDSSSHKSVKIETHKSIKIERQSSLSKLKKSSSSSNNYSPSSSTSSYGSLSSSLKSEKTEGIITNIPPIEHPFIQAIQSRNYEELRKQFNDPDLDPNMRNQQGEPALFIAAKTKDGIIINLFLNDYRTDFSQAIPSPNRSVTYQENICDYINTSNIGSFQFNDLIQSKKFDQLEDAKEEKELTRQLQEELLHNTFARFNLDMTTIKVCKSALPFHINGFITEAFVIGMINKIEKKITNDQENQSVKNDKRTMPQTACFSSNTTEVMNNKIWFILKQLSQKHNRMNAL